VKGITDEGAKRPVTRRAHLLAAQCVRCTQCARCRVSWHRYVSCTWQDVTAISELPIFHNTSTEICKKTQI